MNTCNIRRSHVSHSVDDLRRYWHDWHVDRRRGDPPWAPAPVSRPLRPIRGRLDAAVEKRGTRQPESQAGGLRTSYAWAPAMNQNYRTTNNEEARSFCEQPPSFTQEKRHDLTTLDQQVRENPSRRNRAMDTHPGERHVQSGPAVDPTRPRIAHAQRSRRWQQAVAPGA